MKKQTGKITMRLTAVFMSFVMLLSFYGCGININLGSRTADNTGGTAADGRMIMRFLYVGQADCTLITLPGGETMLIDGGNDSDGDSIADYIKTLGIGRLDYVVSTHPHEDHLGGLDRILDRFEAGHIYAPELPSSAEPDTRNYKDFLAAAEKQDCGITYVSAGDRIYQNGGVTVDCLSPDKNDIFSTLNDYSVVLIITCGDERFLLMGDAEETAENIILSSGADIEADLIKVGHHGSSTSSTSRFIDAVDPDYAVISCGKDNSYGFPHKETLQALSDEGAQVYVTSEVGSVTAVCDGDGIEITCDSRLDLDTAA